MEVTGGRSEEYQYRQVDVSSGPATLADARVSEVHVLVDDAIEISTRRSKHLISKNFFGTRHSHSIVNRRALLIGKYRALLA